MHVMGGWVPPPNSGFCSLFALFELFAPRAFPNPFTIRRIRTLSQNCRGVYPPCFPFWQRRQPRFLFSICATRAFTIFFTSAAGSGLSVGKWMVPLEVE